VTPSTPERSGGTLYVVATPIGNLADVTLRALDILREVPLIAAEDTRLTRRLLDRHGIATRLTSYHARSGPGRAVTLLGHLRGGEDLALVSDAGTPLISDPGADLVTAWLDEAGTVVPIPGPSATLAAIVASGVAGPRWAFEGFLPRSGRDRRERLAAIAADPRGTVVYEAPSRLAATLRDLAAACGQDRVAAVARELTKIHEQVRRGALGSLAADAGTDVLPARGEIVIVVGMVASSAADRGPTVDAVAAARAEVAALVADGIARGDAARRVAAATGIPRRQLYDAEDAS